MSILQSANVTICSPFRDSEAGIAEYFEQLADLDHPTDNLRYVWVEGDSQDNTLKALVFHPKEWAWVTIIKCDTGNPRYGSVVNAERFQVLAQVFNAALDAVDYDWTDYVLFLPSDIRYQPDLLSRLIEADKDIIAPFVWIHINGQDYFYDTWAFQDGIGFGAFTPEWGLSRFGTEPVQMFTVGGTKLIKADVLRAGVRYTPTEVDRGFCKAARAKGFEVWTHPGISVYHPPFAPEQNGLTDVYSRDVERVKAGILEKYRFVPPDKYVKDLIAFMSEFTHDGQ